MRLAFVIILIAFCFGRTAAQTGQSNEAVPRVPVLTQDQIEKLASDAGKPAISLKRALKIAEGYIRKERVSLPAHYLAEAKLIRYGEGRAMKESHWSFRWVRYHIAGDPEVIIIVSMEGKASRLISNNAASNNGMHPTGASAALIENLAVASARRGG